MPWKECSVLDERMKFIAKLIDGEQMSALCEEAGISRKTGYKLWNRYQNSGAKALTDRSRKPHRFSNQLPEQIERVLLRIKRDKPHWGAPKVRELFIRKYPDIRPPAVSTIHAIFDKNGLVICRKRRRYKAQGTELFGAKQANDLWCADFKGEFMMGNQSYCYPLTITDQFSRFLFTVEGLTSIQESGAFPVFERVFEEFGLPNAMRTDNGVPFASPNSLFGLSKLSVWWLRLGIRIERIKPGHPEQNGRHERMHLTLKKETAKPAAQNLLAQQEKFDGFVEEFNRERPHQALAMKLPAEIYRPSSRVYKGIGRVEYPMHDHTITVTRCGRICMKNLKISLSTVFAGQDIGVKEVSDKIWQVTFMDYDLGFFDEESKNFAPSVNPFGAKVLPMSSV